MLREPIQPVDTLVLCTDGLSGLISDEELMRIVAVRERTVELSSATRNSSIGFDAMTASVIAVHTDKKKNGKPLVGLAFDSVGRYGHGGLLRERFIPRLLAAGPEAYADGNGCIDGIPSLLQDS